ncbi:uncharacterized protein LOC110806559 [Carica papaya]|uniref:uncharacterized protein LOC110806559 n=1 Tax=Carica papaya TaxID=3649 RepID=UPI000B8CCCBF|nr:uncharacterized protein LOC110806559 [Carica papaya]
MLSPQPVSIQQYDSLFQDRLSRMEVGFVDRFHQLEDTLRRLTDTLVLNREGSSSNALGRPGQTRPNCDDNTEKSNGGRPPFYSDAKSVAFAGDVWRSLTHGGGGTGEDGNLQIDRIDEMDVISKQFSASLDDAQMQTIGIDDKIAEVYEIDMEKLKNLLSLLQSSVGDALTLCLANMDWNLQNLLLKYLELHIFWERF